jgi:hypothetical protein
MKLVWSFLLSVAALCVGSAHGSSEVPYGITLNKEITAAELTSLTAAFPVSASLVLYSSLTEISDMTIATEVKNGFNGQDAVTDSTTNTYYFGATEALNEGSTNIPGWSEGTTDLEVHRSPADGLANENNQWNYELLIDGTTSLTDGDVKMFVKFRSGGSISTSRYDFASADGGWKDYLWSGGTVDAPRMNIQTDAGVSQFMSIVVMDESKNNQGSTIKFVLKNVANKDDVMHFSVTLSGSSLTEVPDMTIATEVKNGFNGQDAVTDSTTNTYYFGATEALNEGSTNIAGWSEGTTDLEVHRSPADGLENNYDQWNYELLIDGTTSLTDDKVKMFFKFRSGGSISTSRYDFASGGGWKDYLWNGGTVDAPNGPAPMMNIQTDAGVSQFMSIVVMDESKNNQGSTIKFVLKNMANQADVMHFSVTLSA